MTNEELKRETLAAIDAATTEQLRAALRAVFDRAHALAVTGEERFVFLSARELGEACAGLELTYILGGALRPCAKAPDCALPSFLCRVHQQVDAARRAS